MSVVDRDVAREGNLSMGTMVREASSSGNSGGDTIRIRCLWIGNTANEAEDGPPTGSGEAGIPTPSVHQISSLTKGFLLSSSSSPSIAFQVLIKPGWGQKNMKRIRIPLAPYTRR